MVYPNNFYNSKTLYFCGMIWYTQMIFYTGSSSQTSGWKMCSAILGMGIDFVFGLSNKQITTQAVTQWSTPFSSDME